MKTTKKQNVSAVAVSIACSILLSVPATAANKLIVMSSTTPAVEKFVVTSDGYIGSGANPPITGLHLKGSNLASTQFRTQYVGTTSSGGGGFFASHNNNNGALPVANNRIGYFLFGSYNGTTALFGGGLTARAEKAWSPTSIPTSLSFETAPENTNANATSPLTVITRMHITSSGNIGVGTITPGQKLEVNGGVRLNTTTAIPTICNASIRGTLWFTQGASGDTLSICKKYDSSNYRWELIQSTLQ